MTSDFPTHSEQGEENVRRYLRRRQEEHTLYGEDGRRFAAGVRALVDGVDAQ